MTITELGSLGEFFSSAMTLVTLLYLAVQIRQNSVRQKREEVVTVQHGQNSVLAPLQDPRIFGGYVRTAENRSPSIEDLGAAFSFVVPYLNHFQIVHELYLSGALDEEQYQLWAGFAVAIVAPVGIRHWWDEEDGRSGFHSEVRNFIDARLNDPSNPPVPLTQLWGQFDPDAWAAARPGPC